MLHQPRISPKKCGLGLLNQMFLQASLLLKGEDSTMQLQIQTYIQILTLFKYWVRAVTGES